MKTPSLLFLVVAFAASFSSARAATLYTTSFESPTYAVGTSVVGIDGWTAGSGTGVSQTVSAARASVGTQGLLFDNADTSNSFYSAVHTLGAFGPNLVTLTTDLYLPSTNGADRMGEVSLSTGTLGGAVLGLSIDGAGHVRMGTSWGTLYDAGTFQYAAPVGSYADRWLTATLTFNPADQTGTVTLSGLGGATPSYTSSFAGVATPTNANLGTDYLTTAARLGAVYYDNFAIDAAAVPEPGAAALALVGASGLWIARRRRRA